MSSLTTLSVFYYGTTITKDNLCIDFNEGAGELTANLPVNDYSLTEFAEQIATSMTLAGTQTYSCSVDRVTRKITISAASNFSLLVGTGSHAGTTAFVIMGFTGADKTGSNSYESQIGAGFEYRPQILLSDYIQPEDFEVKESAVVNVSVSGVVQTLQFGDGQRMQCNIRGASNLTNIKTKPFFENINGVQDLRNFMKYLITKAKIEFMPNADDRSIFYKMLLESTPRDRNGTSFTIKNMDGADKFFETGTLTFRKVIQ